jgi:hypothetical protein
LAEEVLVELTREVAVEQDCLWSTPPSTFPAISPEGLLTFRWETEELAPIGMALIIEIKSPTSL